MNAFKGPVQFAQIPIQQKIFELCVQTFVEKVLDNEHGYSEGNALKDQGFFESHPSTEEMDEFSSEEDLDLDGSEFENLGSKKPLDEILRMANADEQDDEDNEVSDFFQSIAR